MTRYAIYFAPAPGPFADAADHWLGRDMTRPPLHPDLWGATDNPRRYGFHATLKAPFRLAEGCDTATLIAAVDRFAASHAMVALEGLRLASLDGFMSLIPVGDVTALNALAADIVRDLDQLRAPLSAADIARRKPERLSPVQRAYLDAWGYPYVLDEFRFHMTLSNQLDAAQRAWLEPLADAHFAPFVDRPTQIDALTIFVEGTDGMFQHLHRAPLAG